MDAVERIKQLCKERRIPVSRVEKDLGFANGYISQLKRGVIRGDRLTAIAEYFDVSPNYLLTGKKETPATNGDGRLVNGDAELTEILERVRDDPHLRMLFSITKDATPEDVEKAIKIIQTLKGE